MTSNPLASSTAPVTELECGYLSLTPLVKRMTNSPFAVASTVCRPTDEKEPLMAMLFADNTIGVYDTTTLELIRPVIKLRARARHTLISSIDDSTVVTGGDDGCLIVSNVRTGHMSAATKAHDDDVVSIDSWQQYIVSAGRDNVLRIFRFVNGELLPIKSRKVVTGYVAVKLVLMNEIMRVLVAEKNSCAIETYEVDSLEGFRPLCLLSEVDSLSEHRNVDIAVNETRTLLVAALTGTSRLKIVIGDLSSLEYTEVCNLKVSWYPCSKTMVRWSTMDSHLWVTNNDSRVRRVEIGKLLEHTEIGDFTSNISCLQVCRVGDREVIITGGHSGEITLWK